MAPLRVGLIGYGVGGAVFHAPLIAACADMALTAVVTSNSDRAAEIGTRYPSTRVLNTVEELWLLELDLVVIASPNSSHVPLALQAIERELAVVIDKPAATSILEARQLQAAALANDAVVSVFQNRRWDGDFLSVAELVKRKSLGDVRRFESRFERWRPEPKGGWRETTSAAQGGGLLFDLGSHLIDQALFLFGPVRSVYAEVEYRRTSADDDCFVALRHQSGVLSHLWMSSVSSYLGPRFRVLGSERAYVKYGLDIQEELLRDGATPSGDGWGAEGPADWGLIGTLEESTALPTVHGNYPYFYDQMAVAVRGNGEVPVTMGSAVANLRVIEAAHHSAVDGQTIAVG